METALKIEAVKIAGESGPPARDFKTTSGLEIKRVYTEDDAPDLGQCSPKPGLYPFTRGLYPQGYRVKPWTMRMYCGYGTAKETNKRFHYLTGHGETGLSLAFDLPTQIGLDPDDSRSVGEVGRVGVSICGLWDFERLFEGIDLAKVSVSMTINSTAFILYSMLIALAKKRGVNLKDLRGTVQNDPLKEYIARGTYCFGPEPSLRIAADLIRYSNENTPAFYPISVSGYHIREAGATAVDEVAFTLANALVYLDTALARGARLEPALSRMSFFFGVHNHVLEEIAKFRAARRVWAELVRERYRVNDPKLLHLRFHAQTCGSTLAKDDPINNAVRVALQAMTAVMGGAQSLHTNSYDEAISIPCEEAQLLALRTQQILALETGVADVADPLGGSYAVESLTMDLAARIRERMAQIEQMGTMTAAIQKGFPQSVIAETSYEAQKNIESGKTAVVGVNILRGEGSGAKAPTFRVHPSLERNSIYELRRQRKKRSAAVARRALERLRQVASQGQANLLAPTIEAVEAHSTLGEIIVCLGRIFGYSP
ncbi:MAG: methylmalonyl-CoA mutase family protein [Elusimicrobiota bacterium]